MDIATFHVGQIKAGQFNQFAGNESLSSVAYDQRIDYYDLAGLDVTANEFAQRLDMIYGSITQGRTDGSLIRVSTSVDENDEEAFAKQKQFIDLFYPKLIEYLPN